MSSPDSGLDGYDVYGLSGSLMTVNPSGPSPESVGCYGCTKHSIARMRLHACQTYSGSSSWKWNVSKAGSVTMWDGNIWVAAGIIIGGTEKNESGNIP
jgi:hypothetical protein